MTSIRIAGPDSALLGQLAGHLTQAGLESPPVLLEGLAQWQEAQAGRQEAAFSILCYVPAAVALARTLSKATEDAPDLDAALQEWMKSQGELLRFRHRHPRRSLLIDATFCTENGRQFVQACSEVVNVPLSADEVAPQSQPEPLDPLALFLGRSIFEASPDAINLQEEIEASLDLARDEDPSHSGVRVADAVQAMHALRNSVAGLADDLKLQEEAGKRALRDLREQLEGEHTRAVEEIRTRYSSKLKEADARRSELESELARASAAAHEQAKAAAKGLEQQRSSLAAQHKQALEQALAAAASQSKQALEQAQAAAAANLKQREEQRAQLAAKCSTLESQLAQATKAAQEQQAAGETAQRLQQELDEQRREGELLLIQLHQVQEELEDTFLNLQEVTQQLEKARSEPATPSEPLLKEIAELKQARDEATALAADRQTQVALLTTQKANLSDMVTAVQTSAEERRREADSLLVQLHQLQEEMERLYRDAVQLADVQLSLARLEAENHRLAAELQERGNAASNVIPMRPVATVPAEMGSSPSTNPVAQKSKSAGKAAPAVKRRIAGSGAKAAKAVKKTAK
jgi:myosin heavy subunit